jgi:hypothetical protein
MELMDINAVDVLTVSGIGTSIYSVQIEKGHGYLRLSGDEYVLGGWIEIGQAMIKEVTEGMLLTVPEGTYDVVVSHKNYNTVKQVTIKKNEETTLDLSGIEGEEGKEGTVLFSVTPSDATVFVDGEEVDISGPVKLEYGIHQLMAKAEGYKTSTSYLKVGADSAGVNIVLDESDEEEESEEKDDKDKDDKDKDKDSGKEDKESDKTDKDSDEKDSDNSTSNSNDTVSGNNSISSNNNSTVSGSDSGTGNQSESASATDYYKVYIDNPSGAEVYLDGNYVGIAPISFKKVSGTHVITLRKKGYETRSYTISVDDEKRDASYSFVELEPEE